MIEIPRPGEPAKLIPTDIHEELEGDPEFLCPVCGHRPPESSSHPAADGVHCSRQCRLWGAGRFSGHGEHSRLAYEFRTAESEKVLDAVFGRHLARTRRNAAEDSTPFRLLSLMFSELVERELRKATE